MILKRGHSSHVASRPPRCEVANYHSRLYGHNSTRVAPRTLCRVSQQLLQLEKAVLADMPTEQVIHLLRRHGVDVHTDAHEHPQESQQQQPSQHQQQPPLQADSGPDTADTVQQLQQHNQTVQLPQPTGQCTHQQQLVNEVSHRSSRVAAAAAKRSLLLSKLAAARVAARAKIVRLPLRLTLAGRAGSRRYLTVPVDVEGVGFVDFLLDSSTFYARITPGFRNKLGLGPADGVPVITGPKVTTPAPTNSSSSANSTGSHNSSSNSNSTSSSSSNGDGGASSSSSDTHASSVARLRMRQRVELPDLWLGTSQLPKQQAYVSPLLLPPTRRQPIGSSNSNNVSRVTTAVSSVAGSLGVQVLRAFELDVDVAGNQLAVHPVGHCELGLCDVTGLTPIPCRYTKSGAIVLPVSLADSPPFTGLLDLSATTSIINWEAAALLGMTCEELQQEQQHCEGGNSSSNAPGPLAQTGSLYGYFGNVQVVPDQMLPKPSRPGDNIPNQPTRASHMLNQQELQAHKAYNVQSRTGNPRKDVETGNEHQFKPLRVQQHQVASSKLHLVLGARLPMTSKDTSKTSAIKISPPSRLGVAGLKGLEALGISGKPAMVIGADIWARKRAVLCLKAGRMYIS